ncbi:TetR/AcrR family transcriptional regulator [Marinibaculum pumilum]|uniref:TetR/AcrR family transcriptional regulator n=1 Tax=Marinibaculum pumilum TaxID=1766165 RepID=A0ABV7KY32_9PROT
MQEGKTVRSNRQRTAATRAALLTAARWLFAANGYAETGTPEIVAQAKVTRGALYHHFRDKADLFHAVVEAEAAAVAEAIAQRTAGLEDPLQALRHGADAYFDAMAVPGRARLLLLEGPVVLGIAQMERIDRATGGSTLLDGLAMARDQGRIGDLPLEALAGLLSAAFDRAALAIAQGGDAAAYREAVRLLVDGLVGQRA